MNKTVKRIETGTSRTAEWMCMCRAASAMENNPCYHCDDSVARSVVPALFNLPYIARLFIRLFAVRGAYEYAIARTKYIDAAVRQCLSEGFSQVVIFGAGFDTRALRFQSEARHARFFELDALATQQAKIGQYDKRHLAIPGNLDFIPVDFDKESPALKLKQAGFSPDARTLFILEGVLMYLQARSVDRTFNMTHELAGNGSEVIFDCIYASVLRRENLYYGEEGFIDKVAGQGEQWSFAIEKDDLENFLLSRGFQLLDFRDSDALEEMYFTDASGRRVGRINGTHFLARAGLVK